MIRSMGGHQSRIGVTAWNQNVISSGSRDRTILMHDMRSPEDYFSTLNGHKQEICGMKWSFDNT